MKTSFLVIPFFVLILFGLYCLGKALLVCVIRREMDTSDAFRREEDTLVIYADAESLEYHLRCAIVSTEKCPIPIIVSIRRGDPDRDEMLDITRRMARDHQNISYRLL